MKIRLLIVVTASALLIIVLPIWLYLIDKLAIFISTYIPMDHNIIAIIISFIPLSLFIIRYIRTGK